MTFQSPSFFSWLIFSPTRLSTLFLKGKCHQYICATSLYRKIEVDWRYCYVILTKSNFVSNGKDQNYAIIYKSGAKKYYEIEFHEFFFQREDNKKYHEIAFHTHCQIFKTSVHLMQSKN